jgi:hypothetical protein
VCNIYVCVFPFFCFFFKCQKYFRSFSPP